MSRIISIALVFVFLLNTSGVYIYFKIKHRQIRREVKQKIKQNLDDNELVMICQNKNNATDFKWKGTHEFFYQNSLYDVVRVEKDNFGEVIYKCINDKDEEMLFSNLDELVKKSGKDHKSENNKIEKILKYFAGYIINSGQLNTLPAQVFNKKAGLFYCNQYQEPELSNGYPPPQQDIN